MRLFRVTLERKVEVKNGGDPCRIKDETGL